MLPGEIRVAIEDMLGAQVARGVRAWDGDSPTPTYHLRLTTGRRVFVEAVGPNNSTFARSARARVEQASATTLRCRHDWRGADRAEPGEAGLCDLCAMPYA